LGYAYAYQLDLRQVWSSFQFNAVRGQADGKSFSSSPLVLKYALSTPTAYIAIVGPSWRQTKLNIRRIGGFARNISV
jgi:hypothetical protein